MNPDPNIDGREVQLVEKHYGYPKGTRGIAKYESKHSHGITVTLPDNTEGENFGKPYGWFFCWDEIDLVTENMNKYNVEVGDIINTYPVEFVDDLGLSFNPIASTHFWSWEIVNRNIKDGAYKLTKINKMNKKIIGYKLLKDSISNKAGQIYNIVDNVITTKRDGRSFKITLEEAQQTEWFELIYETKPTEVFVDTLAGRVKVTSTALKLPDEIPISIKHYNEIVQAILNVPNKVSVGNYSLAVETFKVGCKTFHINDIITIQEAIKQVS